MAYLDPDLDSWSKPQRLGNKDCKSCTLKSFFLFPSAAFAIFITQTLWLWSRIGGRVKISHYIQPSNIYIALKRKFRFIFFPWTHFSVLLNCIRPNDVDISYPLFLRCQVAPKALKGHYSRLKRDIRPWANAMKIFITYVKLPQSERI